MKPTNAMLDQRERIRTEQKRARIAALFILAIFISAVVIIYAIT